MSEKYPHLLFKNPSKDFKGFKYRARANKQEDEIKPPEYFEPAAVSFTKSLNNFKTNLQERINKRQAALKVSNHINYIEIFFYGSFDEDSFGFKYLNNFGLSGIKFDDLNTKVIFAIVNESSFDNFIHQINLYLIEENHNSPKYDTIIRYIEQFDLLTTDEMVSRYNKDSGIHIFDLVDETGIFNYSSIRNDLVNFLNVKQIPYYWNEFNNTIEVNNVSLGDITEICDNFDIILSVNSSSTAKIGPGLYGESERDYPFSIDFDDEIPIIGVIDTGISNLTPLRDIIINSDNSFSRYGDNPLIDNVGHGTSIGAFATLGRTIAENPNGTINADAKLLSIKVLDDRAGDLPISTVEELITKASLEEDVRVFVLTINFEIPKKINSGFSAYAFALDKLAYDLDILIFISTGNYEPRNQQDFSEYPSSFLSEKTNIQTPAESINNITIGSVGDNYIESAPTAFTDKNHPTIYTRTYHLGFENSSKHKTFKPDLVLGGGNYDDDIYGLPLTGGASSLQALCQPYDDSGSVEFFYKNVGTSFSTPLAANLVAKIMKLYPNLNTQSYKALLINSTEVYKKYAAFNTFSESQSKYIVGNGIPLEENLTYSNDNRIVMVLEDEISPGDIKNGNVKYYRIKIPEYLNVHPNNNALLEINITLCYKVLPKKNNHLAYNPIHMAFNLFKNITDDELNRALSAETTFDEAVLIKSSNNWSQDAYYKRRILNNSQKVRYTVSRAVIIANDNTFVLGVNCMYHKMIRKVLFDDADYNKEHEFSIAISIRENAAQNKLSGRLYNEMLAINTLDNIGDIELEAEA
ncbi:S8 family peptidase [Tenacibaculum sp. Mcav3-52]|uniref:S8 family peptidase n=1 Tax=Tenacibaculum sp. Mcav3-52 TaxID=2917762 RepID=UPI001EF3B16D|nr:S8 family peptidase [Tenacibaculum sp. Mcav3-52]MCG7500609.1 S8 family peptidase [Tenacibaculum sp. Mcav3-52]